MKHDHMTPVLKELHTGYPSGRELNSRFCSRRTSVCTEVLTYLREMLKEYVPPRTSTSKNSIYSVSREPT